MKNTFQELDHLQAKQIESLQQSAAVAKEFLLKIDPDSFLQENIAVQGAFFVDIYRALVLFPDAEVKDHFSKLGLREQQLTRFVPLNNLLAELDNIDADGKVIINKYYSLLLLKEHLDLKISFDVAGWLNFTAPLNGKPYANKTKAYYYNLYRKRKYKAFSPHKVDDLEEELLNDIDTLEQIHGDANEVKKYVLDTLGGRTENAYLRSIVNEQSRAFIQVDAHHRRFYNLFKLVCADKYFQSEDEYHSRPRYYGRSYASFQSQFVKKLIQ